MSKLTTLQIPLVLRSCDYRLINSQQVAQGKNHSMKNKTERIYLRVTEQEKAAIEAKAKKAGLENNVSKYIRLAALNKKISSQLDSDVALELLKMNIELTKLGNLQRMTLKTNYNYSLVQIQEIEENLINITKKIKEKVSQL